MPMNFEPQLGRALDQGTGCSILTPRVLPASVSDRTDNAEYQYSVYVGDKRVSGIALFGLITVSTEAGRRRSTQKLDFGRDWVLDSIFDVKRMLNNHDDDFDFLQAIAQGLVRVFEKDVNRTSEFLYQVFVSADSLTQRGIPYPYNVERLPTEQILLAEVFVPIHIEQSLAS